MKKILAIIFIVLGGMTSYGQSDIFIGQNFRKAYEQGTRSKDGVPGEKYWQNIVDYDIDVKIEPTTRLLTGAETIVFTNNSPDELNTIVVRLYQNAFKPGAARLQSLSVEGMNEGVNIAACTVDGKEIDLDDDESFRIDGTNLYIKLMKPLVSKEKLDITFEWEQKIANSEVRTGFFDETSCFVGYWYPQIAVYDDIFGWDRLQYTFESEAYNNLANYTVDITAPDNFIVWGTGTLENAEDVLPTDIYEKYKKSKTSDKVVHIVRKKDFSKLKMKSSKWVFKASNVTDFAFAFSDHHLWDASSVEISGRRVLLNNAYIKDKNRIYGDGVEVLQKAMKYFSEEMPGVPYPYPTYSSFLGLSDLGGMEFPMITNIGSINTGVLMHELFHSYFPMYVRTNERRYAWMDEGFAIFTNSHLLKDEFPRVFKMNGGGNSVASRFKNGMKGVCFDIKTCPGFVPCYGVYDHDIFNSVDFQNYLLPGYVNDLLCEYLGREKFREIYKRYVEIWAYKSPTPYDYFYCIEKLAGEDLGWLWKPWFFEIGSADLAIDSFEKGILTVRKVGSRPLGVSVTAHYVEGSDLAPFYVAHNISVWKNNQDVLKLNIPNADKVSSIELNRDMPDYYVKNNYYPSVKDRYRDIDISSIVGNYRIKLFGIDANITEKENKLFIEVKAKKVKNYLIPMDKDHFVTEDNFIKMALNRKDGVIRSVTLTVNGHNIKAVRQ
ncbi:M1 family metallopeptidase [Halosquirtibacter laminarini]|uniref:M1 family metallopeptidase n=1 Tax=Halosquirtibacter laminarini TaxID=3374600 RepID=A0AC61NKN1_9BACT|nr:M1 family metallopeptidase [Prolixibacteraceae bacterium]